MIYVLTVTYADRRSYLRSLLQYAEEEDQINKVILIGNGVNYDLNEFIQENNFKKVDCIKYEKNMGSAYAYAQGLKIIEARDAEAFVFLLDDDNLPAGNALTLLMDAWSELLLQVPADKVMLASLRKDRSYLVQVANGAPQRFFFPQPNAFLGFDLFRIFDILSWKLFFKNTYKKRSDLKLIKIPMAPYGGLFFHIGVLKVIGYPNEDFFVYLDDFEFTYRLTKNNGSVFLIKRAEIDDLEKSWLNKTTQQFLRSRYLQQNDFRAYLSVRNFTFFASRFLVKNRFQFTVNRNIYTIYLFIISVIKGQTRRLKIFRTAIKSGIEGKMGPYSSAESNSISH
jgi:GT2 family glycosyltransferase